MSNLQLPDVLDLVYKHPLFQQKIYETQVSRKLKQQSEFFGMWSPYSPLTTRAFGCLVDTQADGATITFRLEGQSYKSRAATYKVGPMLQAPSYKSHQVALWKIPDPSPNLGPKHQTSSDFASCILISDFQSCVVFFPPGDQLRIGIDTWGATIGGAFAQYQGARVLGGKKIGSLENCKKDSQDSHLLLLKPNKNAWLFFCCFCFCFCSIHPYILRSILSGRLLRAAASMRLWRSPGLPRNRSGDWMKVSKTAIEVNAWAYT